MRKPRFIFVYGLFCLAFVFAHTTEPALRLGIVIVLLGEAIRFWANGYVGHVKVNQSGERGNSKIGQLVTAGPYAFIRNPLYAGSFLIGMGFCIVIGNIGLCFVAVGFFFVLYRCQIQEEENVLRNEWKDAYLTYQTSVPRWIPGWRRYSPRWGNWRWKGILASKEWETTIWTLVLLMIFYFREEFFQEHELFVAGKWMKHALLLGVMMTFIALDGSLALSRHLVRPGGRPARGRSPWIFRQRKYLPVPLVVLGAYLLIRQGRPFSSAILPWRILDAFAWLLIVTGETFRVWGVGHLGRKSRSSDIHASHLVTNGPYAHTRNPLYLGGFLMTVGLSVLTGSVWIVGGCLVYWLVVYLPIIRAEERFLRQTFGQVYVDYCRTVPRWWPRLRPASSAPRTSPAPWRWSGLRKEYQTVAAILAMVLIIQVMLGSVWAPVRQRPLELASRTEAKPLLLSPPVSESTPPIRVSKSAKDIQYNLHLQGVSLHDLMQAGIQEPVTGTEKTWFDEAAGIASGLSTFAVLAVIHEIDDLHDERRFNVLLSDALLAATVGDSTRYFVSSQTQHSLPESALSLSPHGKTSVRYWRFFVNSRDREAVIVITYTF